MDQTLVINFCRPKVAFEISLTLHPTSKPLNLKEKGLVVNTIQTFVFKKKTLGIEPKNFKIWIFP